MFLSSTKITSVLKNISKVATLILVLSYQNCSPVEFEVAKSKIQAVNPGLGGTDGGTSSGTTDGGTDIGTTGTTTGSDGSTGATTGTTGADTGTTTGSTTGASTGSTTGATTGATGEGPKNCGPRLHNSIWTEIISTGNNGVPSCDGKTKKFDFEQKKKCVDGSITNVGDAYEVNVSETGFCNCGARAHGSAWTETIEFNKSVTPSCVGKTKVVDVAQNKTCTDGSIQTSGISYDTNPRETGFCNCGDKPHGTIWTVIEPNGSTGTASCKGKTLYYDIEQDKICQNGALTNHGARRDLNPHEVGTCSEPCPEETIWQCFVGTPYPWEDARYYGRNILVEGPWTKRCQVPSASFFENFENIRTEVWTLADDNALTKVNGEVHMNSPGATCEIKNERTEPGVNYGKVYDLEISYCENSNCAGNACSLTLTYYGRKKSCN